MIYRNDYQKRVRCLWMSDFGGERDAVGLDQTNLIGRLIADRQQRLRVWVGSHFYQKMN